uniref:N-ribosyldihydronicotinamide:quinone dehydrogenase 2 n=1 Tax=Gopherus evgoodei TaxID=1825980 RepID=A0A8C4XZQ1_9SAUR
MPFSVLALQRWKKVLVFYAHQEPKSLNGSLKNCAVEELSKQGCNIIMSDLYAMRFEPRATRNDIIGCLHNSEHVDYGVESREAYKRRCLASDLIEEQRKVQEAKLVIFQFPLYWFSMPAIMKDWMDTVLVQGFAHNFPQCYDDGLLKVRSLDCYIRPGIGNLWPAAHQGKQIMALAGHGSLSQANGGSGKQRGPRDVLAAAPHCPHWPGAVNCGQWEP